MKGQGKSYEKSKTQKKNDKKTTAKEDKMRDLGLDGILDGIKIDGKNPYQQANDDTWGEINLWIPTGAIGLDYAIGGHTRGKRGGIPISRALEISGTESTGKSALLDHIIRETISAGGAFFLCDAEHAHLPTRMRLIGCDLTNFRFIEKPKMERVIGEEGTEKKKRGRSKILGDDESLMVLEEFFEAAESTLIKFRQHMGEEVPIVIALDSLAAIETRAQAAVQEQNMKDKLDKSAIMSQQFGGFCSLVTKNNGSVILINQLRTKPSAFGDPHYSPGGATKDYHFSLRIRMGNAQLIKAVDDWGKDPKREYLSTDVTGILCHGKVVKNKVAEPFRTFRFPLFFDSRGIDDDLAFAMLLVDREKWNYSEDFVKAGNSYSWKGTKLGVGERALAESFKDDPAMRIEMEEELFIEGGEEE